MADDAEFDSYADQHEDCCLPGTRTELRSQIAQWAVSKEGKCIFWLNGKAGTGKSTIARTVARSFEDAGQLGATFFFKRGESKRNNAKYLISTITRQLVLRYRQLVPDVLSAIESDPNISYKLLSKQFDKLLLQPLRKLRLDQPTTSVIVIDALDECEHDPDVRSIIRLLPLLQKVEAVRIRIFVTSRPEPPISRGFSEVADHEYQDLALHEIPEEVTEHDIHLFLQDRFTKIKKNRKIGEKGWPGDDAIHQLLAISVPLFISAATVCGYIEKSKLEPKSRLTELLKDHAKYVSSMDKTYLPILNRLLDDQESDESEQHRCCYVQRFIEQLLQHCGKWPEPKSVLIMDNASFHHSDHIEEICAFQVSN